MKNKLLYNEEVTASFVSSTTEKLPKSSVSEQTEKSMINFTFEPISSLAFFFHQQAYVHQNKFVGCTKILQEIFAVVFKQTEI